MRDSSSRNSFLILKRSSFELPSNLKTNFGVVLDALIKPQPFLKLILSPSMVIFSPSKLQFLEKFSIILNLFSSVTSIFSSGVEYSFGNSSSIKDIFDFLFDISSKILAPE